MGAPIREFEDSEPLKSDLPRDEPSRNGPLRDALQRAGTAPPEALEPPWKPRTQRGVFEGDVAAVELRVRLAQPLDELVQPAALASSSRRFAAVLRYMGFLLAAAAAAGVSGYLLGGFGPQVRLPLVSAVPVDPSAARPPHGASRESNLTPAADLNSANRDSRLPAAQTAAIDLAPASARRAAGNAAAPASQAAARPLAPLPPPPAREPAEITAKMKIGADLMASGDIASARTMFERVAEAGEAAGAFALAETYDPAVLNTLRLRGGIAADPVLARRWYEKARDMGSTAALERIVRLTQKPR